VVPDGLPACVRARHPPDADRPAVGASGIAVVFDVLYFLTDNSNFSIAAGFAIGAGVIGGLLAAAFGLIDWLAIPNGTRAKRIGMLHGVGNVVVVALFAGSWVLRCQADSWDTTAAEFILALVGLALAGATGWLGGELVERLGVGVDAAAGLDARSSLSHHERSARSPRPA
jgi:uncharacterized membrane protein